MVIVRHLVILVRYKVNFKINHSYFSFLFLIGFDILTNIELTSLIIKAIMKDRLRNDSRIVFCYEHLLKATLVLALCVF